MTRRSNEFNRIKRLLGDRYETRLIDAVQLLADLKDVQPKATSEHIRVARLKLALLDRLGLSRVAKPEAGGDGETGQPDDDGFEDF